MKPRGQKKKEALTASDREILRSIIKFKEEVGSDTLDINEFLNWDDEHGSMFQISEQVIRAAKRKKVTQALSKDKIRNEDGELVRNQHPFRYRQLTLWKSLDTMSPEEMRLSYQMTRKSVKGIVDEKQKAIDYFDEHYNPGDPIPTNWNLNEDHIEEQFSSEFIDHPPEDES